MICAVCLGAATFWATVDGHDFSHCSDCGSVALNIDRIQAFDRGETTRVYNSDYWDSEARAARERSWGSSLARSAEAIYVCQRPVGSFLDIGAGDGTLLDSLSYHLPSFANQLIGVELFPPDPHTQHPGYRHGSVADLDKNVDCGVCVEVIEHLTPLMLRNLIGALAIRSEVNACFLFNTGMSDYVLLEDESYIDPINRGHIVAYGLTALQTIFGEFGFRVSTLGSRTWAFLAEYKPTQPFDLVQRTWCPLPENAAILDDAQSGSLMSIVARESLRACV